MAFSAHVASWHLVRLGPNNSMNRVTNQQAEMINLT